MHRICSSFIHLNTWKPSANTNKGQSVNKVVIVPHRILASHPRLDVKQPWNVWTRIKDKPTISTSFISGFLMGMPLEFKHDVHTFFSFYPQSWTSYTRAVCLANVASSLPWPALQQTFISVCVLWCFSFYHCIKTACHLITLTLFLIDSGYFKLVILTLHSCVHVHVH